jgi:hypothetical protein
VGPGAFASCFPDWFPEQQRVFQLPENMDAGHHSPQTAFRESTGDVLEADFWHLTLIRIAHDTARAA